MKCFVFLSILLVAGLSITQSTADENAGFGESELQVKGAPIEKRKVLRRVVRDTFSGMSAVFLARIEAKLISLCKFNGHGAEATTLQDTYDDLKTCLKKKTMFVTPKNAYLAHIDECSKDAVKKTKDCLPSSQKYFPDFILDLTKSVTSFMYDDVDYMKNEVAQCIPRLRNYEVQRSYIQCLADTSVKTHDTSDIPTSRRDFCQKFIPAGYCFTDMLKDTCDSSSNLDKFREDYINAFKQPCEKKET